tara:strand:+ start:987 stop:1106 length:120 start_codon:yes stop_codon:yes gene_type:complete
MEDISLSPEVKGGILLTAAFAAFILSALLQGEADRSFDD